MQGLVQQVDLQQPLQARFAHFEAPVEGGIGFGQQLGNQRAQFDGWFGRLPGQGGEERAQIGFQAGGQERLVAQKFGLTALVQLRERVALVLEQGQGGAAIRQWRVEAVANQLVVLDQPVIRVLRKGQGRQAQGVDHRELKQREVRRLLPEQRQVMGDDIVAEDETGPLRQAVEGCEDVVQILLDLSLKLGTSIGPQGADHEDPVGVICFTGSDLQVEYEAFGLRR